MRHYRISRAGSFRPARSAGFTLIEMIAVIVLLGIVITVVSGPIMNRFNGAKYNAGKVGADQIKQAVLNYQMDVGAYPGQLTDLVQRPGSAANWLGPYTKEANLKDPFGHAYVYKVPGEAGSDFEVDFLGKDGQQGGTDMNADYLSSN
ncbi:MAG TPA: type II secretion system protein GspG [Rhodanobacteraceae bacterium]|nr:type II secretion system protein GspG [Rhodanobacteraceae bacterium]